MSQTTNFPAFLQLNYEENGANARFQSDVRSMTQSAEQQFKASAAEIDRVLDAALSRPRNKAGSLDLGVPELKAAAEAAEARAIAAREVAKATNLAARAEGDYSQRARMAVAATSALAREEVEAAQAARSQAAAAEQVQIQLNKTKSATDALVLSQRRGAAAGGGVVNSLGSQRFAMVQVGQQLQDVTVGFASGQRAATIFAQQLPQLGFAMSGLNGKAGALGQFLAGPWGVAVFAATTALGFFVSKLMESEEATEAAALGADGLSDAQSVLGNIFDLTSGKIKSQNDLLITNARLQAINLRAEAMAATAKFNTTAGKSGDSSYTDLFMANLRGGVWNKGPEDMQRMRASQGDVKRLFDDLKSGKLTPEIAMQLSETMDLRGSAIDAKEIREAITAFQEKDYKKETAELIDKSLDSGILSSEFRRDGPKKREKAANKDAERAAKAAARETSRLASLSDQAAESVSRINERFDDQPRLVDQSAQAVRKLDKLMGEMNSEENKDKDGKSKIPGYDRIIEDMKEARKLAAGAVDNEIGRYAEGNEKNLKIMSLQALGLFDQADILQEINRLDERLGLSSALERLTEQKTIAQNILEDESATTEERTAALGVVEKTTSEIAKINDQQANVTKEVEAICTRCSALFSIGIWLGGLSLRHFSCNWLQQMKNP